MLTEVLTALASTGGTALVTAMVTDSWEEIEGRFARLLGTRDAKETQAAVAQLEQSRAALITASAPALVSTWAEQQIIWQIRLADLLERDPGVENELAMLVAEYQRPDRAGQVEQHAVACGHAQQAVQGYGVQNVTFGDHNEPGASER